MPNTYFLFNQYLYYKIYIEVIDYNINSVKIKNIFCIVGWNKNYIQAARYIHKNKTIYKRHGTYMVRSSCKVS